MKFRDWITRRQLIVMGAVLALGTAFVLVQRYGPRAVTVTAGRVPRNLCMFVRG